MKGTSGLDKPLLLVDVDGVLNVFGFSWEGYEEPDSELEKVFEAMGWTIRFPTGTVQRMARLSEAFDCVWATTWEEKANDLIAPHLGVGADWPVVKFKGWARHLTWKLPDVRDWCEANAAGRRVAWLDDDLHADAEAWAAKRTEGGEPTVLVSTHNEKGLTDRLTRELMEWANG